MVRFFVALDPSADVIMARIGNTFQPLHAVYGKRVLPHLERMALAGELKIQNVIAEPTLHCRIVEPPEWRRLDPDAQSFRNVNTPADLEAARAEAAVFTKP
jgi:molybdopterin-guanine dinucleotide biosynthesis protein A